MPHRSPESRDPASDSAREGVQGELLAVLKRELTAFGRRGDAVLDGSPSEHRGVVEKFAGDAILALFGAPVAHDEDAARALHVALEMHRELAALVPQLSPEAAGLRLHAGVNSGRGVGRMIGSDVRLDYGVLGRTERNPILRNPRRGAASSS